MREPFTNLASTQHRFGHWMARRSHIYTRISLGIVFLWFGLLKFCPGMCDLSPMAQRIISLATAGHLSATAATRFLAFWECAMGLTLLLARPGRRWGKLALRACVFLLLLHLAGTFLPLVLFPSVTWKHFPFAPTLTGQYILKNLVMMSAVIALGANAFVDRSTLALMPATNPRNRPQFRPALLPSLPSHYEPLPNIPSPRTPDFRSQ